MRSSFFFFKWLVWFFRALDLKNVILGFISFEHKFQTNSLHESISEILWQTFGKSRKKQMKNRIEKNNKSTTIDCEKEVEQVWREKQPKMVQNRIFSIEMFHASYFHCYFSHDQKHLRAMHRTQWVYHGKQMFTKQWNRIDSHSRWLETEYTKIKSVVIAASFNRNMTNVEIFVFRQM